MPNNRLIDLLEDRDEKETLVQRAKAEVVAAAVKQYELQEAYDALPLDSTSAAQQANHLHGRLAEARQQTCAKAKIYCDMEKPARLGSCYVCMKNTLNVDTRECINPGCWSNSKAAHTPNKKKRADNKG